MSRNTIAWTPSPRWELGHGPMVVAMVMACPGFEGRAGFEGGTGAVAQLMALTEFTEIIV